MRPDIHNLKHFIIRVGHIHMGYRELSGSLMDYRKAGLALIEQGISDTLCSLDQDLIPSEILDQVEVFFHYLDRHVIDDNGLGFYEPDAIPEQAVVLSAGILDCLDDLLLAADAQAHRLIGTTGYYA
jgi:hypothetical protein